MSDATPPTPTGAPAPRLPQVVEREIVFRAHLYSVERQKIRMPDGQLIQRDVILHPGAAAVLPFVSADEVALVRQYRPALDDYVLEIPAGTLEPGEDPAVCARRECEEETGFRPAELRFVHRYFPTPGFVRERVSLYVAWDLTETTQNTDHDEQVEVVRMPFEALVEDCRAGRIQDGKTLTIVGLLALNPAILTQVRAASR